MNESDEKNKSQILAGDDTGEKKGIPSGRSGAEADMAQAVLFLVCCQYAYSTVRTPHNSSDVMNVR